MDEPPPIQNPISPPTEQSTLVLISHSHRHPLSQTPDIKFDLRKLSNPPKHIRDAFDGRSNRLREHMMHMEDFTSLLEASKKSVEEKMVALLESRNGRHKSAAQLSKEMVEEVSGAAEDDPVQLVVSCFCERGKHRSVAFAEELSRHKWPRDWVVQIHHRDVDEVNGKRQYQRKKNDASRRRQEDDRLCDSDLE